MGKARNKTSTATQDPDETSLVQQERGNQDTNETSIYMHLDKVLAAIADTKRMLQQDISAVPVCLGLLQAKHHQLAERVITVEALMGEIKPDQAALTCNNTPGRKSLEPALQSPRRTNKGITPVHTQERADAWEEKVKTEERGGRDTVACRREKEGKRQREEESERKGRRRGPTETEGSWSRGRGVESNRGREGARASQEGRG
ncbi:hypothetical protein NDU88_000257 [Pleurodeles waltl]|uniref:Uncharacterized protein n=1 Tax=Pleurodeles waltl TaxID=8319 RepID=A0AAV7UPG0_PLEWA|nr:hypothetical protein NDU88_000257 [Pleurodeles waltl]